MSDDDPTTGDWFERTLFVIALVVFLFLGATGPWQAAGPAGSGGCPVSADERYIPGGDPVDSVDDLGRAVVYVTERPAHTRDRECLAQSLAAGEAVDVGDVELSIDADGTVRADGEAVSEGRTWILRTERVSVTDLWYTYERDLVLYNAGPIEGIETAGGTQEVDRDVVLVTGSMSSTAQLNLVIVGVFVAATMLVVGIGLEWSVRYSGTDVWDQE